MAPAKRAVVRAIAPVWLAQAERTILFPTSIGLRRSGVKNNKNVYCDQTNDQKDKKISFDHHHTSQVLYKELVFKTQVLFYIV
jgi:hypothetical protein